jgi:peroxiredoxin
MRRVFDPLLLVLLALSLAANVHLYRRQSVIAGPVIEPLAVGQRLPEFKAIALDGGTVTLTFARPTILYTFSPSCIWCERNLDNARQLAVHSSRDYDFVAVALDDKNLVEYLSDRNLSWRVVKQVPSAIRQACRMTGTPQTIVVDMGGTVRHSWTGAYINEVAEEVESALNVRLPGVRNVE